MRWVCRGQPLELCVDINLRNPVSEHTGEYRALSRFEVVFLHHFAMWPSL